MQRAGRAGRVAPGVCLRLYPAAFLKDTAVMPAFTPAEIERTSLLNLVLKVKTIAPDAPPAALLDEAIQPPTTARVAAAVDALGALGALATAADGGRPPSAAAGSLSEGGACARVTTLGRLVASLPVSVPMGRLLVLGEAFGCGRQAALLAALLTLPDPFLQPYTRAAAAPAAEPATDGAAEAAAAAEDVGFFKPRLVHFTARGCSDPLAALALFDEWQRVLSTGGPPAAAQYAQAPRASATLPPHLGHAAAAPLRPSAAAPTLPLRTGAARLVQAPLRDRVLVARALLAAEARAPRERLVAAAAGHFRRRRRPEPAHPAGVGDSTRSTRN